MSKSTLATLNELSFKELQVGTTYNIKNKDGSENFSGVLIRIFDIPGNYQCKIDNISNEVDPVTTMTIPYDQYDFTVSGK
jgi:hypothetical protein